MLSHLPKMSNILLVNIYVAVTTVFADFNSITIQQMYLHVVK